MHFLELFIEIKTFELEPTGFFAGNNFCAAFFLSKLYFVYFTNDKVQNWIRYCNGCHNIKVN